MGAENSCVKKVFAQYKANELYLQENELPRVNPDFRLTMSACGHKKYSAVEELAIGRAEAIRYNEAVIRCVNRLESRERKIIFESYMRSGDKCGNWEIWEGLYICRATFYAAKRTAIAKLNLLFRLEKLLDSVN